MKIYTYYMVVKIDKSHKQKQTVNVKVHIGDLKKKRVRKPRKAPAPSKTVQAYTPVYIPTPPLQATLPYNQEPYNALLEKLNSRISAHHEELKNSLLSKVSTTSPIQVPSTPASIHSNPVHTPVHVPPIPSHPVHSIPSVQVPSVPIPSTNSTIASNSPRELYDIRKRELDEIGSIPSVLTKKPKLYFGRTTSYETPSHSGILENMEKPDDDETEFKVGGSLPKGVHKSITGRQSAYKILNQRRKAHENEEGFVQNYTGRWVRENGQRGQRIKKLSSNTTFDSSNA